MLLQSFHFAAKKMHMPNLPDLPATGASVAVCQPNRDTKESGHLQAVTASPAGEASTWDLATVPQDKKCTETTKPPTKSITDNVPIGPLPRDK